MSTNYNELVIGSKTNHGTIKSIFGSSREYIVFLNEDNNPKILCDRKDINYRNAVRISKKISADAYKKFKGAHKSETDGVIASCIVEALEEKKENANLEKYFSSAKKHIKMKMGVKRVFGAGPKPYHVVYLNNDNTVGVEISDIPENIKYVFGKLHGLLQTSQTYIPRILRLGVASAIGSAFTSIIRSDSDKNRQKIFDTTKIFVELKIIDVHHIIYIFTNVFFVLLISVIAYFIIYQTDLNVEIYFLSGTLGGALGAVISSLQRVDSKTFSVYESRAKLIFQSISRIFLGIFSGVLLVSLSKAGLAFGIVSENIYGIFAFSFAAGFTERFIPTTISNIEEKAEK